MASGRLGTAAPASGVLTKIYTAPADTIATVNVLAVNRGADDATIRLALSMADAPPTADFVEYNAKVSGGGGVLERFGLVVGAGEKVIVQASTGNVSFRVNGFEGAV